MYEWTTVTVDVKRRYAAQDVHAFLDGYLRERVDGTPPESYYKDDGRVVIRLNERHLDTAREAVDTVQEQDSEVFRAAVLCANDDDVVTDLYVYDWLADADGWFQPVVEFGNDTTGCDVFSETMTERIGWVPATGYWVDGETTDGVDIVNDRLREVLDDIGRVRAETKFVLFPEARPNDWENPLDADASGTE